MNNQLHFRLATINDLYYIVSMLADDTLGASREKASMPLLPEYIKAFEIISADPKQELIIVEMNGETVGTFQLTFIQNIAHRGGLRAQVESVRTHATHRGKGIGKKVFEYIIDRAKEKGCVLLQLTSDKQRPDAIRFYEKLGFVTSHEGMKIKLK
ncbi:MAG TPA: GNAT family N-acetyltransferase [Chitinophagaceae bacterium]|nr:GNAT family N-acetyltransferase [Chitinophagaceae bacterium]HQZ51748.1 GNAT family N-acetyltransferase [Chitinophagaceae bacterium]HRA11859.1 GNAT family N-acetyltransferase [Chitinophagaceae bacterium]